jgi:hypothetical protein
MVFVLLGLAVIWICRAIKKAWDNKKNLFKRKTITSLPPPKALAPKGCGCQKFINNATK